MLQKTTPGIFVYDLKQRGDKIRLNCSINWLSLSNTLLTLISYQSRCTERAYIYFFKLWMQLAFLWKTTFSTLIPLKSTKNKLIVPLYKSISSTLKLLCVYRGKPTLNESDICILSVHCRYCWGIYQWCSLNPKLSKGYFITHLSNISSPKTKFYSNATN